jgi:hypothetical protein
MAIKGGLHHQILYIDNVEWIDGGYGQVEWNPPSFLRNGQEIPEEDYVEIHDDFFRRFNDCFIWIETYNPCGPKEFNRGFNYYGQTAIHGENLVKFGELIDSLLHLFENAPENITLTGDFCFGSPDVEVLSDDDGFTGYYVKVEVKKDTALKIFGDLKNMTARAIENNGYLLHFGI